MQPLPNQFNLEPEPTDLDEDLMVHEPINAGAREAAPRITRPRMPDLLIIKLAVSASVVISAAMIMFSVRDTVTLGELFGHNPKPSEKIDPQQVAIDELKLLTSQHSELTTQINAALQSFREEITDIKTTLANRDEVLAQLDARVKESANDIRLMKIQQAKPKPVAASRPAPPKPRVFVFLVSMRSQGGSSWVTLRRGLDTSPLMAVGDEWNSIKLVSADPYTQSAQVLINGATSVVKL